MTRPIKTTHKPRAPSIASSKILVVTCCLLLLVPLGAPPAASEGWPQFRRDNTHSGIAVEGAGIIAPHPRFVVAASGPVLSSPAVHEVDGEPIIFFASYDGIGQGGTLYAYRGDGTEKWSRRILLGAGYVSSPTVADLTGNGNLEVLVASLDDSTLRVFDARTGSTVWSRAIGASGTDLIASSPVVAKVLPDVPGKQVIIGGSKQNAPGNLLIFDRNGNEQVSLVLDGPSWSTPLVADLDGDGQEEIVIATGLPAELALLWPTAKTGGQRIYAFKYTTGWNLLWDYMLTGPALSSPAIGDLDGDGLPEIVVGAQGGVVVALSGATGTLRASSSGWSDTVAITSPVIVDVDGDGQREVVIGTFDGVVALRLSGSSLLVKDRLILPPVPINGVDFADPIVVASVAVGDVDGDGGLDIVGMTLPINFEDPTDPLSWQALPGTVFAVKGSDMSYASGLLWEHALPNDGGIGGPIIADLDGDGWAEIILGEGLPIIGDGAALHVLSARNPIIRGMTATPPVATRLDTIGFAADVVHEGTANPGSIHYLWDFKDGDTSNAVAPGHVFASLGVHTVELTVTDPQGLAWSRTIDVEIANLAPVMQPVGARWVEVETPLSFQVAASDPEGDALALGAAPLPAGASFVDHGDGTATFEWIPAADDHGAHGIVFSVTDGIDTVTENVQILVARAPVLHAIGPQVVATRSLLEFQVTASDPDGDALTLGAAPLPAGATFVDHGGGIGTFRWTPPCTASGTRTVTFTVTDGLLQSSETVTIDITTGTLASIRVVGGAGEAIGDRVLLPGDTLTAHARGYNAGGCLLGEESVLWGTTGDLDAVPPGPASSVVFTALTTGTSGTITANHTGLSPGIDAATGLIMVSDNEPPVALLIAPTDPVGLSDIVVLDGTGSHDRDGTLVRISLDPGDGSPPLVVTDATLALLSHSYPRAGMYTARLEVEDERGAVAAMSRNVTVFPVQNLNTGAWHPSLQVAVDSAGAGDVIEAHSHVYRENVVIERDGLEIRSAVPHAARIVPASGPAVTFAGRDLVLVGLRVHAAEIGLLVGSEAAGRLEVSGGLFLGTAAGATGIEASVALPQVEVVVTATEFRSLATGIRLGGASIAAIVEDSVLKSTAYGIVLDDGAANATVAGNTFHDVAGIAIETGDGQGHRIVGNRVFNSPGTAVRAGGTGLEVRGNLLMHGGTGIQLAASLAAGHQIEENEVRENAIGFAAETAAVIRHNDVRGNGVGATAFPGAALDARYNWWGHWGGPMLGDSVAGAVQTVPWCVQPGCPAIHDPGLPLP